MNSTASRLLKDGALTRKTTSVDYSIYVDVSQTNRHYFKKFFKFNNDTLLMLICADQSKAIYDSSEITSI